MSDVKKPVAFSKQDEREQSKVEADRQGPSRKRYQRRDMDPDMQHRLYVYTKSACEREDWLPS
jgi:hypothetical protein